MAQKLLIRVLNHHNIPIPTLHNMTNTALLQDFGIDIPEGIPALLEFSKVYSQHQNLEKTVAKTFVGRHFGGVPAIRHVAVAWGADCMLDEA